MKTILKLAAAAVMAIGVAHAAPPIKDAPNCIQVITPAYNPATGECREFPTPCAVPKGWIVSRGGCSVAKADTGSDWRQLVDSNKPA